MVEKNQIQENDTTVENATGTLRKYNPTAGYSCKACGNPFDTNPPDDVHRFSSVYPCWKFDWIERSYECSRCSKRTKLFWHQEVHKHYYDYATVEEIEHKTSKNNLSSYPEYMRRMVGY